MTDPPPSRLLRAAVFAAVCVGVSATGHTVTAGAAPPVAGPAAGFALVFAVAWAAARTERGLAAVCGWMLWGQAALHVLFSAAPADALGGPAAHHAAPVLAADASGGPAWGMIAAHAAAALVSGWWLRRGEAAAFSFVRYVRTLLFPLRLLTPWSPSPVAAGGPVAPADAGVRPSRVLRHVVSRRGPPLLLV
jgi:hypothetical protein